MKCLFAAILATTALVVPYQRAVAFHSSSSLNVNSRYSIERVFFAGERVALPPSVRRVLHLLHGQPFEPASLDRLEAQIREACPGYELRRELVRGSQPGQLAVRYVFERSARSFSFTSPRFLYHSSQQFSFGAGLEMRAGQFTSTTTVFTENDVFVERATGIRSDLKFGRYSLRTETLRADWALPGPQQYHGRTLVEPTVRFDLSPELSWTAGFRFNHLDFAPTAAWASTANAFTNSLRYRKQLPLGLAATQTLEAGYHLRAATQYQRQLAEASLLFASDGLARHRTSLRVKAQAGSIRGQAPLFERFVAGNSQVLRGWRRQDLSPLGADRLAHVSLDIRHHFLRLLYDTGTVWQPARPKVLRHSAGVGFTAGGFTAMIAIPIRSGPVEPVLLLGMNF